MGYSCTQDAGNTLAVIGKMFATNGNPNVLTIHDVQYFFERGREQADGAITGSLYMMLSEDMCQNVGGVKIAPDGTVVKFPKLTRDEREEAANTMRDMSAQNPSLLHSWSLGRV